MFFTVKGHRISIALAKIKANTFFPIIKSLARHTTLPFSPTLGPLFQCTAFSLMLCSVTSWDRSMNSKWCAIWDAWRLAACCAGFIAQSHQILLFFHLSPGFRGLLLFVPSRKRGILMNDAKLAPKIYSHRLTSWNKMWHLNSCTTRENSEKLH